MPRLFRLLMTLVIVALVTACAAAPAAAPDASAPAPDAGAPAATGPAFDPAVDKSKLVAQINFLNWTDYLAPEILTNFEATYGVKVVVDNFDANEDMIAKVRAGGSGYDLVTPSDYAVQTMAAEGLLQPLDKTLLTNSTHIEPSLLNKYFDEGNTYSMPYMYGITGIAYNKKPSRLRQIAGRRFLISRTSSSTRASSACSTTSAKCPAPHSSTLGTRSTRPALRLSPRCRNC